MTIKFKGGGGGEGFAIKKKKTLFEDFNSIF